MHGCESVRKRKKRICNGLNLNDICFKSILAFSHHLHNLFYNFGTKGNFCIQKEFGAPAPFLYPLNFFFAIPISFAILMTLYLITWVSRCQPTCCNIVLCYFPVMCTSAKINQRGPLKNCDLQIVTSANCKRDLSGPGLIFSWSYLNLFSTLSTCHCTRITNS